MTDDLHPGIRFIGPALFLETTKTLIFADIHLGAEAALVGRGVLLPRTQKQDTFKIIKEVLAYVTPQHIVLNGDLKHEFGSIHDEEWRDVLELLDVLNKHAPVTVIKGNHDVLLLPILRKRHVPIVPSLLVEDWLVVHGDKMPDEEQLARAKGIIIGHEHPSLLLDDGIRKEKYKCFLMGVYQDKQLIVVPSMYPLVEGSDVLKERSLGPILKIAKGLEAYVVEGMEVLFFGPLGDIDDKP